MNDLERMAERECLARFNRTEREREEWWARRVRRSRWVLEVFVLGLALYLASGMLHGCN